MFKARNNTYIPAALLLISIALVSFTGCGGPRNSLKIAGSTTVLPISQLWAEKYMAAHSDASISLSGGGTGVGISSLINGSCDIANASRPAKQDEIDKAKAKGFDLTETRLCKDGLAIVVNSANDLTQIDLNKLGSIYSGAITTWAQAGGKSAGKIVVVGRDSSSGTYGYFQEEVLKKKDYVKSVMGLASNQAVVQAVEQSPDAIGYVGIAYAKGSEESGKVRVLAVSKTAGSPAILPSDKTIEDETYPLFRYLLACTKGKPTGLAAEFLTYCTGAEGQKEVPQSGYLPL